MAVDTCEVITPTLVWSPAETLSPRVRRLRDQYWSFYTREYTNEVRAYTTGTPWDHVYSPWNWTNVPEMVLFLSGAKAYLRAAATPVDLPPGFWKEPLGVRRAIFFRRVVEEYLPVQILEGELIVGSHFNAALSRTLTRAEACQFARMEKRFLKELPPSLGLRPGERGGQGRGEGNQRPSRKTRSRRLSAGHHAALHPETSMSRIRKEAV